MESPVVLDKPPEYCGKACNDRGFPFDEEEGSSAWSDLASRHPDIAARLRSRPSTWARKRRPSDQQSGDEFGSGGFENFDSFPFDNIPSEFRGHFPSHWNRRFGPRENSQQEQAPPQTHQQHTTSTQTEDNPAQAQSQPETVPPQQQQIPQYGLRNTVDLGQKSAAVDDDRSPRSMSAPPESRTQYNMNQQHEPAHEHQQQQHSNVRHIPIFVEGRDEPVINKSMDHGPTHGPAEPAYSSPPQAEREQYFGDEFHHPSNFPRSFGAPFNKGFRGSPQPFVQQKVYPQSAFARGASPQRSQSPRSHEEFVKIPVHHETHAEPHPPRPQQNKPQQQQPKQQQQQQQQPKQQQQQQHQQVPPQQQQQPKQHQQQQHQQVPPQQQQVPPQQQQAPPQSQPAPQQEQKPQPPPKDPITQILSIQTDVLNLMNDVENFQGVKSDKKYLYLDEMLTRNLIKLDNIETEGKENIRQARKEAIKCIEKCIAVLEAKAEKGTAAARDVEMSVKQPENGAVENGETKEETKDNTTEAVQEETKPSDAPAPQVETAVAPQEPNTRPEGEVQTPNTEAKEKKSPKKGAKAKKNKEKAEQKTEEMNVDGDKVSDSQNMEVDGAAIPSQ